MLDEVLLILGIPEEDVAQRAIIAALYEQSSARICAYINEIAVPAQLNFILNELTISRYNRLGSEGIVSESVEGIQYSYVDDELSPYYIYLDRFVANKSSTSGFRFI